MLICLVLSHFYHKLWVLLGVLEDMYSQRGERFEQGDSLGLRDQVRLIRVEDLDDNGTQTSILVDRGGVDFARSLEEVEGVPVRASFGLESDFSDVLQIIDYVQLCKGIDASLQKD